MSNFPDDNEIVPSDDDQNLDWQAFQYISGGMSAGEVAAFEDLLAVDQAAREAVARSVELLGQMSTASASKTLATVAGPQGRRLKIFAAVVTVAASVAVWLSFVAFHGQSDAESGRELISLWTEPRDSDLLSDDSEDELAATESSEPDGLVIPGWLFAALESPADEREDN